MVSTSPFLPIFEVTRGHTVESIHHGAVAVVSGQNHLLAWYGDPEAVTFLRSTAKPFQVLPFLEQGGQAAYGLSLREIAILCSSHSGTDAHVAVIQQIQAKTGVSEDDLLCGVHPPHDKATAQALSNRGEQPTSNRHNCSGNHTGMLAFARLKASREGVPLSDLLYTENDHPIQVEILAAIANMCGLEVDQIALGVDGCSAPNFAMPLRNAALGFRNLCDPESGGVIPKERGGACHTVISAMTSNPDMVAGVGRFDTLLMEVTHGRIVSKGGAEGFQGLGVLPGSTGQGSSAIGIAFKVADGDSRGTVRSAVALEILQQLGILSMSELKALADFGPSMPVFNLRKLVVGEAHPTFQLCRS
jgi:L-asparaginase II